MSPEFTERFRRLLTELHAALVHVADKGCANEVERALVSSDVGLQEFLGSNELWGGAGSIADEAGMDSGRDEGRRRIEAILVRLGEAQQQAGLVNVRTRSWVDAFREWARRGL